MTIEDIKLIIAPDEHRELELKKTTGELKDGMRKKRFVRRRDSLYGKYDTSDGIV